MLPCFNCGAPVPVGALVCPKCGVNIKTGESYESRVDRAKAKELHPERYRQGIYAGVTALFFIILLSGFMFQRRNERILTEQSDRLQFTLKAMGSAPVHCFRALDEIQRLASTGDAKGARELGNELIQAAEGEIAKVDRELAQKGRRGDKITWTEKWRFSGLKSNLKSVISKAEFTLSSLPESS